MAGIGVLVWIAGGIYFVVSVFGALRESVGLFWTLVLVVVAAPATFTIAPFWMGFARGDWSALLVGVISFVVGLACMAGDAN